MAIFRVAGATRGASGTIIAVVVVGAFACGIRVDAGAIDAIPIDGTFFGEVTVVLRPLAGVGGRRTDFAGRAIGAHAWGALGVGPTTTHAVGWVGVAFLTEDAAGVVVGAGTGATASGASQPRSQGREMTVLVRITCGVRGT